MKRYCITYIGELPPPYGGVTVKNSLLLEQVFNDCNKKIIDLMECKRKPYKIPIVFCRIILSIIKSDSSVIAVGSSARSKILISMIKFLRGKKGLKKCSLIVMGGDYCEVIKSDLDMCGLLGKINSVWVESEKMIVEMQELGLDNIFLFPNCRNDEGVKPPRLRSFDEKLKLVFFSRICSEKGFDIIMDAYKALENRNAPITLDIYGELAEDIKEPFEQFIHSSSNVSYHGVYDAVRLNVYAELNQYDVMLLPTHWEGEGVPGALIESKMAGITAIVSDWNVNCEVIRNGTEGIVLSELTAETLAMEIFKLCNNPEGVQRLKDEAFASRKRYCVETYRKIMLDCILEMG